MCQSDLVADPGFPSQGCQPLKSDGNLLTVLFTKPLSSILPVVGTTSETILATDPIHGFSDGMVEQWNSTRQSHGTAGNPEANGFVNSAVNGSHLPFPPRFIGWIPDFTNIKEYNLRREPVLLFGKVVLKPHNILTKLDPEEGASHASLLNPSPYMLPLPLADPMGCQRRALPVKFLTFFMQFPGQKWPNNRFAPPLLELSVLLGKPGSATANP